MTATWAPPGVVGRTRADEHDARTRADERDAVPGPLERFLHAGPGLDGDAPEAAALWTAMADAARGGRRLRPALVVAGYQACRRAGRPDAGHAAVLHVADAVELLHAAFVMHDDVIDDDDVRRGRPNVVGTFTRRGQEAGAQSGAARGYGRAAGILAGDLALVGATRLLATTPAAPGVVSALLDLLDRAVTASAAGELQDVRLALGVDRPTLDEVLAVTELKTAAYSFCLPLCAGAVLAGADARTTAELQRVGRLLGIAFQLQDDLLGVFGDEAETGKSALGDLREGKLTALVAHARTTSAWPRIAPHLGDPGLTASQAQALRTELERCGSRDAVEGLVEDHLRAARERTAAAGLPTSVLADVERLVRTREGRAA
jgi:geranylgeranyl diphosphate synthase, type II